MDRIMDESNKFRTKVSDCDVDRCEVCFESLVDYEFLQTWDGPVCDKCAKQMTPVTTH